LERTWEGFRYVADVATRRKRNYPLATIAMIILTPSYVLTFKRRWFKQSKGRAINYVSDSMVGKLKLSVQSYYSPICNASLWRKYNLKERNQPLPPLFDASTNFKISATKKNRNNTIGDTSAESTSREAKCICSGVRLLEIAVMLGQIGPPFKAAVTLDDFEKTFHYFTRGERHETCNDAVVRSTKFFVG
jgi:hypothetical protein